MKYIHKSFPYEALHPVDAALWSVLIVTLHVPVLWLQVAQPPQAGRHTQHHQQHFAVTGVA